MELPLTDFVPTIVNRRPSDGGRTALARLGIVAGLVLLAGCGGSGSAPVPSDKPTAKTVSDVTNNIKATGLSIAGRSFQGPTFPLHRAPIFAAPLAVYLTSALPTDEVSENFFSDAKGTSSVGSLLYTAGEGVFTLGGTFSLKASRFGAITGFYNQVPQMSDAGITGFTGSINFSCPNGTFDSQFLFGVVSTGGYSGTASSAVVLKNEYTQTEKVNYSPDGSAVLDVTDSTALSSTVTLAADGSGVSTITGKDPGLPAKATWDNTGAGLVTYADASTQKIIDWSVQSG